MNRVPIYLYHIILICIIYFHAYYALSDSQCIKVKIISGYMTITIFVIYGPPNSKLNEFLSDNYSYLTNCSIDDNTIIIGDFNIKMNLTTH